MLLISTSTDCKQKGSTFSKKLQQQVEKPPAVCNPFFLPCPYLKSAYSLLATWLLFLLTCLCFVPCFLPLHIKHLSCKLHRKITRKSRKNHSVSGARKKRNASAFSKSHGCRDAKFSTCCQHCFFLFSSSSSSFPPPLLLKSCSGGSLQRPCKILLLVCFQ